MKSQDRYRTIWNGGLICLLMAVLAYFVMPLVIKRLKRSAHRIYAISAATVEVKDALVKFDAKYGGFPNASTIESVRRDSGTSLPLGSTSSNDFLRQLIALDLIKEKPFHVDAKSGFLSSGGTPLGKGKCEFAYVVGQSLSDESRMPVFVAPVIPGTNRIDRKRLGGKAAVFFTDGSITHLTVNIHGHIALGGGKRLDPAAPMWNGKPITIVWPE